MKRRPRRTLNPLYKTWVEMRYRCENRRKHNFKWYGGRGIKVCLRWQSFENFLSDMAPRPAGRTLERRNNNGHYSPANCYWATKAQQMSNTRSNRFVRINGKKLTFSDACRMHGITPQLGQKRVDVLGWPLRRAVTFPVHRHSRASS